MASDPDPSYETALRQVLGVTPVDEAKATAALREQRDEEPTGGLYGGQLAAQCVTACEHTVPGDFRPESCRISFLSGGTRNQPIEYQISSIRDGRNLIQRDVRGLQGERLVVHALVACSTETDGLDWQAEDPPPEIELGRAERPTWAEFLTWGLFDIAHPADVDSDKPASHPLWVRTRQPTPPDPWLYAGCVAYWSDLGHNGVARDVHFGLGGAELFSTSANHSVWFHRRASSHEWHLLDMSSRSVKGNQGFTHGVLYDSAGRLVASMAQSVFMRSA